MTTVPSAPRRIRAAGFAILFGLAFAAAPGVHADGLPAAARTAPVIALAEPPPPPPPSEPPPPPPPPGVGLSPVPVEPGSAVGLSAPTPEERSQAVHAYAGGMPEVRVAQFDPTGRFLIPQTGLWNRSYCPVSFFAAETMTYDSNIYASEHGVEDDWISNTSAGIAARREGSCYWARGSLALTYSHYFENDENDALNLYGEGQMGWKGVNFYAGVEDRVGRLENPIVIRDDKFIIVDEDLDSYWQNTLRAYAGYDGCRLHAELEYIFDLFVAESGPTEAFNHTDHSLNGRVDYYVSDKTSVGAFVGTRFVPFSDSTQNDFNTLSAGATASYRPTEKVGIQAMLGGGWANSDGGDETYSAVGSLDVMYDPTPCLEFDFGWSQSFEPSLGADYQVLDLVRLRAQASVAPFWLLIASTGVQFGDTINSTADGAKDYALYFLDLMAHRSLGDNFGLDFGYQFRTQDADGSGTDFDQHRLTVGLSFYR